MDEEIDTLRKEKARRHAIQNMADAMPALASSRLCSGIHTMRDQEPPEVPAI
jgi:hypothetical protein